MKCYGCGRKLRSMTLRLAGSSRSHKTGVCTNRRCTYYYRRFLD